MGIYDTYKTDSQKETEGIVLDYGDCGVFTIAHAGVSNREYTNLLSAKLKPLQRRIQVGSITDKEFAPILAEVYAKTIIKSWSNVQDEYGNDMPFTVDNCVKLLVDLPHFFSELQEEAQRVSNFRKERVEDDSKK